MAQDEDDEYTVVDAAAAATRMLRHNVPGAEIKDILPDEFREDAWTLARLRKQASDRFENPWELFFDEDGLRYATPDTVARARANRLAPHGDIAVDVACGVGIQLAFLAHRFDTAIGIEQDPERARLARRNLDALDADATILTGDCLDPEIRDQVPDPDVVVCDPARAPEADKRDFDGLSPDIRTVHNVWAQDTNAYCYELPPMMPPERVHATLPGECEYTSLNHDLNRLALYGHDEANATQSALTLPSNERLTNHDPTRTPEPVEDPDAYLLHVDRTILQAQLLPQATERANATGLLTRDHPRRTLLTAATPADTAFTQDYELIDTHDWNLLGLHEKLKRNNAGKVVLRASIDPDRYWDVRNALEDGLDGDRTIHLFRVHDTGYLTQQA